MGRGVYVISWSQLEIDGRSALPVSSLIVGAVCRWTGQALRVDGATGVLLLDTVTGRNALRARAARSVRRIFGDTAEPVPAAPEPSLDRGSDLAVTDGVRDWTATLVDSPECGWLLVFAEGMPPEGTEVWVVRPPRVRRRSDAPGGVICFVPGTHIRSENGAVPVEALRPGDRVLTRDDGAQEIVWTGRTHVSGARLHVAPDLRPIRFRAGALGLGRPDHDLLVSPGHRMLVAGAPASALFGTDEVLVAAADLIDGRAVAVDHTLRYVTYVHVMLARHHVVWANGLPTETFHPTDSVLDTLPESARGEIGALVSDPDAYGPTARRCLRSAEAAILRHGFAA